MLVGPLDTEAGSEDGQARGQQPRCTNTTGDALPVQAEHQDTCHGLLAHPLEARQLGLDLLRAQVSQGFDQESTSRSYRFVRLSRLSTEHGSSMGVPLNM